MVLSDLLPPVPPGSGCGSMHCMWNVVLVHNSLLTLFQWHAVFTSWKSCLCHQEKLRFQAIRHAVTKVDCQPTAESGVVMLVTGQLKVLLLLHAHSFIMFGSRCWMYKHCMPYKIFQWLMMITVCSLILQHIFMQPVNSIHHRHLLSLLSPEADTHFTNPRRVEGWVDLGGWHTEMVYPPIDHDHHPNNNRAWRRVTSLMCPTTLPLVPIRRLPTRHGRRKSAPPISWCPHMYGPPNTVKARRQKFWGRRTTAVEQSARRSATARHLPHRI